MRTIIYTRERKWKVDEKGEYHGSWPFFKALQGKSDVKGEYCGSWPYYSALEFLANMAPAPTPADDSDGDIAEPTGE